MHEDQLSPELGRLIDAAKAAAARVAPSLPRAEGVAVLTRGGAVYAGYWGDDPAAVSRCAAESALASARRAGDGEVLAAAVAVANDPAESVFPSPDCRRSLADIDPDLPLVVKQSGRWVLLPLSRMSKSAASENELTIGRLRRPDHHLLVTLAAYDLEAFGPTGLRTYDLAVMAEAGAIFLAQIGGETVGSCQLFRVLDEPGFLYVVGFYIRPEWQGRDLGRALLLAVAEESRKLGAEGLVLTVAPENVKALNLYRSAGFVDEAFVPHFYGEGEDRHILRWRFPGGACQAVYDR